MGGPMRIALDTNVLIYFLEGIEPYASEVEGLLNSFVKGKNEGIISTISVAEVLTGFYRAGDEKGVAETKALLEDLTKDGLKIVPVTPEIADLAARLKAKRGGRLPATIVVATAIARDAELIYSEDEDLQRFNEDIRVLRIAGRVEG